MIKNLLQSRQRSLLVSVRAEFLSSSLQTALASVDLLSTGFHRTYQTKYSESLLTALVLQLLSCLVESHRAQSWLMFFVISAPCLSFVPLMTLFYVSLRVKITTMWILCLPAIQNQTVSYFLQLNADETEVLSIGPDGCANNVALHLPPQTTNKKHSAGTLAAVFDQYLNFKQHIKALLHSCCSWLPTHSRTSSQILLVINPSWSGSTFHVTGLNSAPAALRSETQLLFKAPQFRLRTKGTGLLLF